MTIGNQDQPVTDGHLDHMAISMDGSPDSFLSQAGSKILNPWGDNAKRPQ